MITDNQVYDLEAEVRRLENSLAQKKRDEPGADLTKFETELLAKRRQLEDMRRKQRNDKEQELRNAQQKKMDDRRESGSL
jgi:hypothetical protein